MMWCFFGLGSALLGLAVLLMLGLRVRVPRPQLHQLLRSCVVLSLLGTALLMLSCGFLMRGS